jgi:hypothetical protein
MKSLKYLLKYIIGWTGNCLYRHLLSFVIIVFEDFFYLNIELMLTKGYNILASEEPEASSLDSSYLFAWPGHKKSIQRMRIKINLIKKKKFN